MGTAASDCRGPALVHLAEHPGCLGVGDVLVLDAELMERQKERLLTRWVTGRVFALVEELHQLQHVASGNSIVLVDDLALAVHAENGLRALNHVNECGRFRTVP